MTGQNFASFTSDHVVHDDGTVSFACSHDAAELPFVVLPPHHPGLIQALSYFVSVESAMAMGLWDPDKWSALTWTRWRCGEAGVGQYDHGVYSRTLIDGKESFSVDFFDAQDQFICVLEGRGVVFRTRDFETWRQDAKDHSEKALSDTFGFAEPPLLGVSDYDRPFLGPLQGNLATGLVDQANGMLPGHRWLNGSGDHVNSAHLAEIGRQFVTLLNRGKQLEITAAEMRFDRYVELGTPFEIEQLPGSDPKVIEMQLRQSGRDCTWLAYNLANA